MAKILKAVYPFKVRNWLRFPIPLFLYVGLFFIKNGPRGFWGSIKDALAEIWKRFKVKSEIR